MTATEDYISTDEVRSEAGFDANTVITDANIELLMDKSNSEIDSTLLLVYVLPLASVPDIIADVAKLLSAGRLLAKQYAGIDSAIQKEGWAKMKEARGILKQIAERKMVLIGTDGNQLARIATGKPSGWPNSTTADEDEDNAGGGRMFTRLKKF